MEPSGSEVTGVLKRNIERLVEIRRQADRQRRWSERLADRITAFAGSMAFLWLHVGWVGGWLAVNSGAVEWIEPFDPFPFVMLAMVASVEAIFLSTFVLISQNRMAALADRRADLDLQISLLAEHEITRVITLINGVATRLGVEVDDPEHIEELERDIDPTRVMSELDRAQHEPP
jgi:uncharacterized membrane protein